jgi:uncharacterized MAPEG superfamily protein
MAIPVFVLLGFAAWTMLTLIGSIGVCGWSRILTGRTSIAEWYDNTPRSGDWYQRAVRAHINCVETLPIYGAIAVTLVVAGLTRPFVDGIALTILVTRIGQTLVHIVLPTSNTSASLRFALFSIGRHDDDGHPDRRSYDLMTAIGAKATCRPCRRMSAVRG